jgi:hypothetical protein
MSNASLSWLFLLVAILFVMAILGYMSYRLRAAQDRIVVLEADLAAAAERLETESPIRHVCHPPAFARFGARATRPAIPSDYLCICGVRYVLVRVQDTPPGVPQRLGWITAYEHENGTVPLGVAQDAATRPETVPARPAAGGPQ